MGPLLALLGVLLAILVGAALLQLSVAGANRLAGGSPAARPLFRGRDRDLDSDWDKLTWEEWDAAREPFDPEPERPKALIPKPHLGIGMAVVFLTAALGLLAFVLINFALEDSGRRRRDQSGPAFLLTLPVAYFAMSVMLVGFLPTTFRRALLVALVFALSLLAFFLCVGALIFVLRVGMR
jgi:hypothetical protein